VDHCLLRALLTSVGQEALQAAQSLLPRESDYLLHFQTLNRSYSADLAQAALETAILRREAASKFSYADRMYLTREALEQASSEVISHYRAERYKTLDRIVDLGCSIGSDTFALAQYSPTLGLDKDPLRLALAQANRTALKQSGPVTFLQADLRDPLPLPHTDRIGLFFDPSRRLQGRRTYSVSAYQPPLSVIDEWLNDWPSIGVKLSPGVKLAELSRYTAELEFISVKGELKEAVLWFGPLMTTPRRATLLPGRYTLVDDPFSAPVAPIDQPRHFLYEPDPAILRAGLVATLAVQIQAAQLDPDIAYLTTEQHSTTPYARAWLIEDWFPFQLKRLRTYLRARQIGRVTVKKRGSPLEPTALIRALRLEGTQECVLFLTHWRGQPIVIISQELDDQIQSRKIQL
jgi:SAM-dependent methyltransferase